MRILLLNQYGPETDAPTGRILGDLATGLRAAGHQVVIQTITGRYGGDRRGRVRLAHELLAHARLAVRSALLPKVGAVISFTSPACLVVTAGMISRWHGSRHYHWAMDLYPELGVALGELPDGTIARFLGRRVAEAYRRATRVVALDEDMRAYLLRRYSIETDVVAPIPQEIQWPTPPARSVPRRWVYSGNLGRAHEIDVLLRVQQRLEAGGVEAELVLRGQGAQWHSSQRRANEMRLRRVRWQSSVPASALGKSLLEADVLVVTRKASLTGLLLPSKLLLAELSGRPVLWIGDTDSHTASRLRKGGHGVFAEENPCAIASWLTETLGKSEPREPQPTAPVRDQGLDFWANLLRRFPS